MILLYATEKSARLFTPRCFIGGYLLWSSRNPIDEASWPNKIFASVQSSIIMESILVEFLQSAVIYHFT